MIAAYLRVSTDDQTTALQRDAINKYIDARTILIAQREWYEDVASGAARSRPGLDALMADVRAGRFTQVVVYKFDRFARSTQHLLEALEEFRSRGVTFTSLSEGIDTGTAVGRMVYTFLGAIAEFERELIRERVRAGMAAARRRGVVIGRQPALMPGQVERAVALVRAGHSKRKVAREFGIARSTLRAYLAESPSPPPTPDPPKRRGTRRPGKPLAEGLG